MKEIKETLELIVSLFYIISIASFGYGGFIVMLFGMMKSNLSMIIGGIVSMFLTVAVGHYVSLKFFKDKE